MRKGRSSRRSRSSRPLIGGKGPVSTEVSTEVLGVDSRLPNIVVEVPGSQPPVSGTDSESTPRGSASGNDFEDEPVFEMRSSVPPRPSSVSEPRALPDLTRTIIDPVGALPLDPLQALEALERPVAIEPTTKRSDEVRKSDFANTI